MDFESLVAIFSKTGVEIACLCYFMIRDWRFMSTLETTLTKLNDMVVVVKELIQKGED